MSQVLDTGGVAAADRFPMWNEFLAQAAMPVSVRTSHTADFDATLQLRRAGAVELLEMRHPPLDVDRTPKLIRRSDPDVYHLVLSSAGDQYLTQDGKEVVLRPGDMTLYHSSRAFSSRTDPRLARESATVLMIPSAVLPLPQRVAREVVATRLPGDDPLTAFVIDHLRTLRGHLDRLDPADGVRLSTVTLDLVGHLLARRLDAERLLPPDTRDRVLFARIIAFAERRLADPELSPEMLAAAHHLSLRSLHRQFAARGLTAAGWIRARRLENCHRDLGDPLLADRPVAAVAGRWGLGHRTLDRAFRRAYGISPAEYRHAMSTSWHALS
ncbi:AraC family transcriptional regulator [Catellatospora sp. TT07R-123]|uniref:AraC-like ligand-binding domain-containing protein n=1 Tax=Catellatospora sp. TT07R-123 TaxID=2733863 RepID=UPI001B2142B0|nr:helix-turn-helix domain-containing protein [Catellatospora sp. TT07R-123]GHJ44006.1 AraC family transcriptional regulator [Catellatospora sp. TT07R-123]